MSNFPSLFQRAATFARAAYRHATNGFAKCDEQTIFRRLEVCQSCPAGKFNGTHCTECGCACNGDSAFMNKLAWMSESCPLGHWPEGTARKTPRLTVGMACYRDFDGVYFTLRSLQLHHPEIWDDMQVIVVDNCPEFPQRPADFAGPHTPSERIRTLVARHGGVYVPASSPQGTAFPRDLIFQIAEGDIVICVDSHVLLEPGAFSKTVAWMESNPDCNDLIQGPMLYDDGTVCDHLRDTWGGNMWGQWGDADPRSKAGAGEPFEIQMHGLGLFGCRRGAWLGFNPHFRAFGGEEGYIHEKYRKAGRRTLCLPWLRWAHRFNETSQDVRPARDTIRNYVLGFSELDMDLQPIYDFFFASGRYQAWEWGDILEEVARIQAGESVDDIRAGIRMPAVA